MHEAAMTSLTEMIDPMRPDERDNEGVADSFDEAARAADADIDAPSPATGMQPGARSLADRVALEVQEHPIRSLAIAGLVGFLIASSMKYRTIPAMLRSGAGIAAAMVLREIAERGLSRLDVGAA
jgi:hypothetical protein